MIRRLAIGSLVFLASCASVPNQSREADLETAYQAAVKDAEVVSPAKRFNHLTPIRGDVARVLVANWTNRPEYKEHLGGKFKVAREVWVTVVPELSVKCEDFAKKKLDLDLRVKELLGLPPSRTYSTVVEFWVAPKDVFRPCPDPEIDDDVCDLELSDKASKAHRDWFIHQEQSSYSAPGYPWTRLGYTYDWSSSSMDHFGLSEYVVKAGSMVQVKAVYSTRDYCGATDLTK